MTRAHLQNDPSAPARQPGSAWRRRIYLGLAGMVGVATLAACGSSPSPAPVVPAASSGISSMAPTSSGSLAAGSLQPTGQPAVITISKFAYGTPASVSPGAMVTVLNKDGEAHTVTADSGGAFDDKASPGASTQFMAPTKPGSYPFHCTYHSNMHGVLVVK
ncbi:MAG TPA: cupredoxin domain-containing protein [Jatrophihabitans sp.]|nr:cupredoxin domain-containing protein [Jatrophihabitans sp.]